MLYTAALMQGIQTEGRVGLSEELAFRLLELLLGEPAGVAHLHERLELGGEVHA